LNQSAAWVWWDGPLDDAVASQIFTVDTLSPMTNNIGFALIGNTNNGRGFWTLATGARCYWMEVTGPYFNAFEFGEGSVCAFFISGGTGGNCDFGYCWAHDMTNDNRNGSDGFAPNPGSSSGFDGVQIHHSIIERIRDNGIGGGGSLTINDCIIRDWV